MSGKTTRNSKRFPNPSGTVKKTPAIAPSQTNSEMPDSDIAQEYGVDLQGLATDHKTLAITIIQAITKYMDRKMDEERRGFESTIEALKNKLTSYEEKLDDLECYGRRNTIVISGPEIPPVRTNEDCIEVVKTIIASKLEIPIDREDICVAHRLGTPKPGSVDKRNIIAKLVRRTKKHEIYKACGLKKPKNIFFSDSVSKTRNTIMYALRKARERDSTKIGKIRTRDGNIRLQLPNPENSQHSTTIVVNTRRALEEILRTRLNIGSAEFDCRW